MNRLLELEKELAQYSLKGQNNTLNSPAGPVSTAQSVGGRMSREMGNTNKVCILSIDGGGIRGLIPALILEEIEKRIRTRTTKQTAFIQDFVDFYAGTSTGGIISAGLLVPRKEYNHDVLNTFDKISGQFRPARPEGYEYSISELAGLYSGDDRNHIFCGNPNEIAGPAHARQGATNPRSGKKMKGVDAVLKEKFGKDLLFTDLKKPLLITSIDLEFGFPKIFCNVSERYYKDIYKAVDVVRATSAAPTFFDPADVTYTTKDGKSHTQEFVDGGLFQNNPAFLAFNFVRKNFDNYNNRYKRKESSKKPELVNSVYQLDVKGNEMMEKILPVSEVVVISLGTGFSVNHIPMNSMDGGGSLWWAKTVINLGMGSNSEGADLSMHAAAVKDYYVRINPPLPHGGIEMDDISDENIDKMNKVVNDYIRSTDGSKAIDKAVELLVKNNYW